MLATLLDDIERGKGYRDDADDVVRLVRMFWGNWAKAEGKTPIDAAYLKESEADVTEVLANVNELFPGIHAIRNRRRGSVEDAPRGSRTPGLEL